MNIEISVHPVRLKDREKVHYAAQFQMNCDEFEYEGVLAHENPKTALIAGLVDCVNWVNQNLTLKFPIYDVASLPLFTIDDEKDAKNEHN